MASNDSFPIEGDGGGATPTFCMKQGLQRGLRQGYMKNACRVDSNRVTFCGVRKFLAGVIAITASIKEALKSCLLYTNSENMAHQHDAMSTHLGRL